MKHFPLKELIEPEILQEIQDAFAEYSGLAARITDAEGAAITKDSGFTRFCMELTRGSEAGCKNCEACDRQGALMTLQSGKPAVYECHAGLTDFAAPILLNGEFVGSFFGGQGRPAPGDEEKMRSLAESYGVDPEAYVAAAKATTQLSKEFVEKSAFFLSRIAEIISRIAYQKYQFMQKSEHDEQSVRSKNDVVVRFSNELKQKVAELTTFFSQATTKDPEGQIQRNVDKLLAQTLMLGAVVEDTMDYVEIMNGTFDLKESVYGPRSVFERKVMEYRQQAAEKGDTLTFSTDENVPDLIMGDPGRICSVIGKLVENSIRYTENSFIEVHIGSRTEGYALMLEISVRDGGVGIEKKQAAYIRSYMLSRGKTETTDEEFEMLGFSLVGYCVNAMHGDIELNSAPGEGTEFIVRIPQLAVAEEAA